MPSTVTLRLEMKAAAVCVSIKQDCACVISLHAVPSLHYTLKCIQLRVYDLEIGGHPTAVVGRLSALYSFNQQFLSFDSPRE